MSFPPGNVLRRQNQTCDSGSDLLPLRLSDIIARPSFMPNILQYRLYNRSGHTKFHQLSSTFIKFHQLSSSFAIINSSGYIGSWNFLLLFQRRGDPEVFDFAARLLVPLLIFSCCLRPQMLLAFSFFGIVALGLLLLLSTAGMVMLILLPLDGVSGGSGNSLKWM